MPKRSSFIYLLPMTLKKIIWKTIRRFKKTQLPLSSPISLIHKIQSPILSMQKVKQTYCSHTDLCMKSFQQAYHNLNFWYRTNEKIN